MAQLDEYNTEGFLIEYEHELLRCYSLTDYNDSDKQQLYMARTAALAAQASATAAVASAILRLRRDDD